MKRYLSLLLCLFPLLCGGFQGVINDPQSQLARAEKDLAAAKTDEERFIFLGAAAMANYRADHLEKAEKYAKELLTIATKDPKHWNYSNAIHKGNLVLGRLALKGGDTKNAKSYLLASVKLSGAPQVTSVGPNMTLAKELLEKGESETVLKFLEECERFWEYGKTDMAKWRTQLKEGKTPDFGGYHYY